MRVRHFGNTANNAFHNAMLLDRYAGIASDLPIRMFGLQQAISAPAWDVVDFEVLSSDWLAHPDWSQVPDAVEVNTRYADLPAPGGPSVVAESASVGTVSRLSTAVRSRVFGPLRSRAWAQPAVEWRDRRVLAGRPPLPASADGVDILYGAGSMFEARPSAPHRTVCLEHGTIRWIAEGTREETAFRAAYRAQVADAMQLWVTNLDPRTLELAEDVAPGRWSAFPHPFMLDDRVPFAGSPERRAHLLRRTAAEVLVLLPSSQNWSAHHDKGSKKALTAFTELRRAGVPVGMVAVEWGLQLAESKAYLEAEGLAGNVVWVPPMARIPLQRMMADVDVVWDQFGLDAFGALALRIAEQGTPFVSRGLVPDAERLIGGPVPWRVAATTDEIVRESTAVFDDMSARGRDAVIRDARAVSRAWLIDRHSPAITAALQAELYPAMADGSFAPGSSAPDRWSQLIDETRRAA